MLRAFLPGLAVLAMAVQSVSAQGVAGLHAAEERETARLETLAVTDPDGAGSAARALRPSLEGDLAIQQDFAETASRQEASMRGLAGDAEADARRNRERADAARAAAAAPGLSADEAQSHLRDAAFWDRQAEGDAQRARERQRDADRLAQDRERLRDSVDILASLIARLDAVIDRAETSADATPDTAAADTSPGPDDGSDAAGGEDGDDAAPYELALEQVTGIWRPQDAARGEHAHVIVQADPEGGNPLALELHTPERVWTGRFDPFPPGSPGRTQEPRMQFTYTPRADEMNPAIPEWARKAVEGQLVWRLDIDETGAPYDPHLSVKFYRGRVRWREDGERGAEIAGDGAPEVYDLEPETVLFVEEQGQATLGIRLASAVDHDAFADPIDALLKGQRFHVLVRLPAFAAWKAGPSMTVEVRGESSGARARIVLEAGGSAGAMPVTYSNREALALGDCHALLNPPLDPPFLSMPWLMGVTGDCVDFQFEDGEAVTFEFEGAAQQIRMYRSWVQRALVRHQQGLDRLTAVFNAVLTGSDMTREQKDAARLRMQMLVNLRRMLENPDLTDVHKYAVAELYLGEASGPGRFLGGLGPECLPPPDSALGLIHHDPETLRNWDRQFARCSRPQPPGSDYDTPAVRAFIEGMTGQEVAIRAPDRAEAFVVWTSEQERAFVRQTLAQTSRELLADGLKAGIEDFAFGLYDGYVTATGADQVFVVFEGTDHFGRRVSRMERVLASVRVGAGAVLAGAAVVRSFNRIGSTSPTGRMFSQDKAVAFRSRSPVRDLAGEVVPRDIPTSVKPAQRARLRLVVEAEPAKNGTCDCARQGTHKPPSALPARVAPSPAPSPAPVSAPPRPPVWQAVDGKTGQAARAWVREDGIYGRQAQLLAENADGSLPRMSWARSTCNAMASAYIILKRTGQRISEMAAQNQVTQIIEGQAQAVQPGGRQLTAPLQDPLSGKWFNLRRFRQAGDHLKGMGWGSGFDQFSIRDFLRQSGLRVAENNPDFMPNQRITLRHYLAAVREGYMVKTVVKLSSGPGQHSVHAIVVQDVILNPATGRIAWVDIFDPLVGVVRVGAKHFDGMLARDAGYGIFTAVK